MINRAHLFASGTTSGLTLASAAEFLREVNWQNFLTLVVSAGTAVLSMYVSARQARREQNRLDREAARQQQLEDALQELKIRTELAPEIKAP